MNHTIVDIFKRRVNEYGPRRALMHKVDGHWVGQSWREWWEQAERVAAGLISMGLKTGDAVAILANTRIEWAWLDMGIAMAGGVGVPIYPSSAAADCAYILRDSRARFVFVEDPHQLAKLIDVRDRIPSVERAIYFDRTFVAGAQEAFGAGGGKKGGMRRNLRLADLFGEAHLPPHADPEACIQSFDSFLSAGRRQLTVDLESVTRRRRQLRPEDLAGIFYTSGATGNMQGVEHSHASILAGVESVMALGLLGPEDRQLIFLPMARLFTKILFLSGLSAGGQTAFAESLERMLPNLREVSPTFVCTVPRVLQTIQARLLTPRQPEAGSPGRELQLRDEPGPGLHGAFFDYALRRGRRFSRLIQRGQLLGRLQSLEYRLYQRLIFERVNAIFGGKIRFFFCGGAPLSAEVAESFHAAGLLILEGYGLTEAGAVSTLNLPTEFRFGSVGKPLPGVDLTIAEDGEILVRGAMLFARYRGAEGSQQVDEDGWLHTGDLGHFDPDGFLHITGRKHHMILAQVDPQHMADAPKIKTQKIAPEHIERRICRSNLIDQAVVYGGGPANPGAPLRALITLSAAAETWAIQRGISFMGRAELAHEPEIKAQIDRVIGEINQTLAAFERIHSFRILPHGFSLQANELTAGGKLRRNAVISRYGEEAGQTEQTGANL